MSAVTAVLVGAGSRGRHTYGAWALEHPDRLRIVGVVEPDEERRERFGELHGIAPSRRFADLPDDAGDVDAWIIAGPDRTHHASAVAAITAGCAVLLEKPIAATAGECRDVVARADTAGVLLRVAFVLRSTPFFRALRDVVASGDLGDIIDVAHRENVAAWHMAHSFVRGNWARASTSTPMVVQKTCHDFDIVSWVTGRAFEHVASFGSLSHFRADNAPAGATTRCSDGCPVEACPFDARRIYLDERITGWPVDVITADVSQRARLHAIEHGRYGRCVYTAGSDVVDHQVTAAEMEGGVTATLTMHGHAPREERTMRYEGTKATLRGRFGAVSSIEVLDHVHGSRREIAIPRPVGGHGGGDAGLISAFVDAVSSGAGAAASTGASTLGGHLAAFAAEASRLSGRVVALDGFGIDRGTEGGLRVSNQ